MRFKIKWANIRWFNVQNSVDKLQKKIYYFSKLNNIVQVRRLQRKLFKSRKARLLSIYKIVRQNRFIKFAGIDSLLSLKSSYYYRLSVNLGKVIYNSPIRHLYFFNIYEHKSYHLLLYSMADRCQQEFFKTLMQPEWDAKFEQNSFGFISGKTCYDILYKVRKLLSTYYMHSMTLDISKCIFFVNLDILISKINFFGFFKHQINIWLKSFRFNCFSSSARSYLYFQGRSIYILFINIILYGLELKLNVKFNTSSMLDFLYLFRYFNIILVFHTSLIFLISSRNSIFEFFKRSSINIYKIKDCFNKSKFLSSLTFNFLGFTVTQFNFKNNFKFNNLIFRNRNKTFFYPSLHSILRHQNYFHCLILKKGKRLGQRILINKLNVIIKAWIKFFGNFDSNLTGHVVKQDYLLYLKLLRWVKRHKGSVKKGLSYWQPLGSNKWVFMTIDRTAVLKYHLHYV